MANTTSSIRFIDETHAQVTKAFAKRASIFGTPEFNLWREYLAQFPKAQMVFKAIKRNPDKRTNRNMTYANMVSFISTRDDKEELLREFEKRLIQSKIQQNPYRYVLAWFEQTFTDYTDDYKAHFTKQAAKKAVENNIFYLAGRPYQFEGEEKAS